MMRLPGETMSKELFVTSTPHETKLAVMEDDRLVEVFFERENEYTLAGSIYKGRVTRVLPGMQSAFVDIGLERDAFLYVTDFMELEELEDHDPLDAGPTEKSNGHSHAIVADGDGAAEEGEEQTADSDAQLSSASGEKSQNADSAGRKFRSRRRRRGRRGGKGNAQEGTASTSETELTQDDVSSSGMAGEQVFEGGTDYEEEAENILDEVETMEAEARSAETDSDDIEHEEIHEEVEHHEEAGHHEAHHEHAREEAPFVAAPPVKPAPKREYVPLVLPGESLKKFSRKPEPADTPARPETDPITASAPITPFTVPLRAPSTLYTGPVALADGGLLAGETRRKRPEPQKPQALPKQDMPAIAASEMHAEEQPTVAETHGPKHDEDKVPHVPALEAAVQENLKEETEPTFARVFSPSSRRNYVAPVLEEREAEETVVTAPVPFAPAAETERVEERVAEVVSEAPEAAESTHQVHDQEEGAPHEGAYGFRPGRGEIEEEEITEEEHDHEMLASEYLDEIEQEELEEETLEMSEHAEDAVLAAGDRLAAAVVQSRAEAGEMTFGTAEYSEVEETMVDEGSDEIDAAQEEAEVLAEGDDIASEEVEGSEIIGETTTSPERAQSRSNANARFQRGPRRGGSGRFRRGGPDRGGQSRSSQQRTSHDRVGHERSGQDRSSPERSGRDSYRDRSDRSSGDRPQRSGRPPMRGGGGRRPMHRGPLPLISDLLKEGQEVLVQIAKEPMAKKGARITSHIALPGRFIVFMPSVNHTGVSRKIASIEERQRLKRILLSEKGDQHGGFIVRTAASGANEEELRADIRFLLNLWSEIRQRAEAAKPPALIYHDLNLVERILRDQVTGNFTHIWVDNESEYERILRFANRFQPSLIKRVKMWTKNVPLFESFGITDEINKALKSKVWLKSGGSIVINQTEALVAIDINTGKFVGKTARLEDTITKTNIDAIKEIVRQIRLRDLGGIIIIDFIDMDERKNRQRVLQELESELRNDRSPSKVLQFNDFGLVAITRKRVKQSLERTLGTQCTYCTGTGFIKSVPTVCNEIYVEMRKMAHTFEGGDVMLRVHPEVGKHLKADGAKWLMEMEEVITRTIIVKSDPSLHQEQFDMH